MPIVISCDCGRALRVKDDLGGRKIRCPDCKGVVAVPVPQPAFDLDEETGNVLLEDSEDDIPVVAPPPMGDSHKDEHVRPRLPAKRIAPLAPSVPLDVPAAPIKRRKLKRSNSSRRSGPLLVVHREIVVGLLMMLGATVWFVLGLFAGIIFFYPPILFVLGILAIIRGATSNN